MKRSKLILGLGALLLAGAGAYATTANNTATDVWYDNAGTPTKITVPFNCAIGDPTCVGESGPEAGKQLYQDQQLSIELERN